MKVKLTESNKHFIDTLDEADKAKIIITEDTLEMTDDALHDKLIEYHKTNLNKMRAEIEAFTAQLRVEHPEYFE